MEARGTVKWRINGCCRLEWRGGSGGCSDPYWGCSDNLDSPRIGEGESEYSGGDNRGIVLICWG